MKHIRSILSVALLSAVLPLQAEEEEVFEYQVGDMNWLTGEGVVIGGVVTPMVFVVGTTGIFEEGASAGDFATTEHDPQLDTVIQGIEIHLGLNFNDIITGDV
ncbi:MAG: hypothetical protein AAF191_16145, partial [Verrucomicrobiota bacterium]